MTCSVLCLTSSGPYHCRCVAANDGRGIGAAMLRHELHKNFTISRPFVYDCSEGLIRCRVFRSRGITHKVRGITCPDVVVARKNSNSGRSALYEARFLSGILYRFRAASAVLMKHTFRDRPINYCITRGLQYGIMS